MSNLIPIVFKHSRFKGPAAKRKEPKSTKKLVLMKKGIIPYGYIFILLFSSCSGNLGLGQVAHCSQYTYDKGKQIWVNTFGKQVSCTIVDNQNIFPFYPEKGCDYWREFYHFSETVKFVELPIRTGVGQYATAQNYCVKQQYLSIDNSGQVLLIDEGVFCLTKHREVKEDYTFASCQGVQKKAPEPTPETKEAAT